MASQEYWKNRETEAKKHNIQEEAEYNRQIKEIYAFGSSTCFSLSNMS